MLARVRELTRFDGRLSRLAYWRATLLLMAVAAVSMISGYGAMIVAGPLAALLLLPVIGVLIAACGIYVRRLHDRDKAAIWVVPFVALPVGGSAWITETDPGMAAPVSGLLVLALFGLQVWGLVEVGFLSGTKGTNRFGRDPKAPPPEEVFA